MNDQSKPPIMKFGPNEFRWGGVIVMGLIGLVAFVVIKAAVVRLLIFLAWGATLFLALLLLLTLIGVGELALNAWRNSRRQREVLQASPLPRSATVRRLAPPSSEFDRVTAGIVQDYVQTQWKRDPASLTDTEIGQLRREFPDIFARPEYATQFNAGVVRPLYEKLIEGCPPLERQLRWYGEVEQRQPLWLVQRFLHTVTRGRVGLSAKQSWRRHSIAELKADPWTFSRWLPRFGTPLLSVLERELQHEAHSSLTASESPRNVPPPMRVRQMLPAAPDTPQGSFTGEATSRSHAREGVTVDGETGHRRDPEQARWIVQTAVRAIDDPVPWTEPHRQLSMLEDAAYEALAQDPESLEAKALLDEAHLMQARLLEFEKRFPEWMHGDTSEWPPVINEAFVAAAGSMSPEVVRGHAARLFLTRHADLEPVDAPSRPESEPEASEIREPEAELAEFEPPYADQKQEPANTGRHLTLVDTIELTAAQRAEKLF